MSFQNYIAAPSAPPANINGYHVQPSYIILRWGQPPFVTLNGRLTQYVVRWRPIKTQRSIRSTGSLEKLVDKSNCRPHCQVKIDSLEPFQVYGFQVAAKNVVDVGKFSDEKSVRTAQAGIPLCLSLFSLFTFLSENHKWAFGWVLYRTFCKFVPTRKIFHLLYILITTLFVIQMILQLS